MICRILFTAHIFALLTNVSSMTMENKISQNKLSSKAKKPREYDKFVSQFEQKEVEPKDKVHEIKKPITKRIMRLKKPLIKKPHPYDAFVSLFDLEERKIEESPSETFKKAEAASNLVAIQETVRQKQPNHLVCTCSQNSEAPSSAS